MQAAGHPSDESLRGERVKALLVWSHQEKLNGHLTRVRCGKRVTVMDKTPA